NFAMGSPPGSDLKEGRDCVYDADVTTPTYLFERGNDKNPVKDRPLTPGVPAFLGGTLRVEPVELPLDVFDPALRPEMREQLVKEGCEAVARAEAEWAHAKDAAVPLAEKRVAAARASLTAVEARIAADLAKIEHHPTDPKVQGFALVAGKAEREAALRQAEVE